MKRIWTLWLCLALLLSLAACAQQPPPIQLPGPVLENQPSAAPEGPAIQAQWAENVDPVAYVPDWTVETSSEAFLRELTDPKYQGRVTGSIGNQAAADWIESLYLQWGLQPLPDMGSYRHSYPDQVFEILPGYATVVAADGAETRLEPGVDWVFIPSFEEIDLTLPLSEDLAACEAGTAFLDGNLAEQEFPRQYIEVSAGDVAAGTGHDNPQYSASQIIVTQAVYDSLKAEGAKLHLQLPAAARDGTAQNVVGYLPGGDSTRAVLVSAHFDGSGQCGDVLLPSAYDNASGTAAMLQTAAWLSGAEGLPCDVIFAAFNGEENGKDGSKYFSTWLGNKYEQLLVVNIDCVGWAGQPLTVYGHQEDSIGLQKDLAGGLEIQYKLEYYNSDQANFIAKGMNAVVITQEACMEVESIQEAMHSTGDVMDNLDTTMIDGLAKGLCAWVLERGANQFAGDTYRVIW